MCFLFYFCLFRVCCGNSGGQEESPLVRQRDDHPSGDLGRPTGKAQCYNPCTPQKSFGNVHKFPDNLTLLLLHSVLLHFTTFTRNSTFLQVQQCLRRYPHNGHIFTEISEKLAANGYSRSPEQCHTRIKRLKGNYRQCRENMR